MAYIKDTRNNLCSVGEVIDALSRFPRDMPVASGCDDGIVVYREEAEPHEDFPHEKGIINIEGANEYMEDSE